MSDSSIESSSSSSSPAQRRKLSPVCRFVAAHPYWFILLLSLLIGFGSMLLFSTALSPLYGEMSYNLVGVDSNFFLWCGKEILAGKKPYLNFDDHKGILIFYYAALGELFGGRGGVAFLNGLTLFLSTYFTLLGLKAYFQDLRSVLLGASLLFFFYAFTPGGNQNGEIILPFTALALLFFLLALRSGRKRYFLFGTLTSGVLVAIAFHARPSDAFPGIGFCVAYLVYWILHRKEQGIHLLYNVLSALGSFALVFGLLLLFCQQQGYLEEMLDAVWLQNFSYGHKMKSVGEIALIVILALYLVFVLVETVRLVKRKSEDLDLVLFLAVSSVLFIVPNFFYAKYIQYWISEFPVTAAFLVLVLESFPHAFGKKRNVTLTTLSRRVLPVTSLVIALGFLVTFYGLSDPRFSKKESDLARAEIEEVIPEAEMGKPDNIYVLDANSVVLFWTDNKPEHTPEICYQSWHTSFRPELEQEIEGYIDTWKPAYVIQGRDQALATYDYTSYLEKDYHVVTPTRYDSSLIKVWVRN